MTMNSIGINRRPFGEISNKPTTQNPQQPHAQRVGSRKVKNLSRRERSDENAQPVVNKLSTDRQQWLPQKGKQHQQQHHQPHPIKATTATVQQQPQQQSTSCAKEPAASPRSVQNLLRDKNFVGDVPKYPKGCVEEEQRKLKENAERAEREPFMHSVFKYPKGSAKEEQRKFKEQAEREAREAFMNLSFADISID